MMIKTEIFFLMILGKAKIIATRLKNKESIKKSFIHELKKKIPQISSLNEISTIIEGFEYGQKRINEKNIRTVSHGNLLVMQGYHHQQENHLARQKQVE